MTSHLGELEKLSPHRTQTYLYITLKFQINMNRAHT